MSMKRLVMIVEDEASIRDMISTLLMANDYSVVTAENGRSAVMLIASYHPDLILLDLGLPDMDGLEVLRTIRTWSAAPVIVVSARGQESEKVEALDAGAGDYIVKPFGTDELLARIRATLRYTERMIRGSMVSDVYHVGGLKVDFGKRVVTVDGQEVHLTQIEFKILALLCKDAGRVLTYEYICRNVWGPYSSRDNQILRVNVANIRRKIEKNPAQPKYILTEVGVGYRLVEEIKGESGDEKDPDTP